MKTITIDGVKYKLIPMKNDEPIILEQNLKFEVYHKDLGEYNWKDAKKVCEELKDGWRLPTRQELHLIWLNKDDIGGFSNGCYWTSNEVYNKFNAWNQYFLNGSQNSLYKANAYNVRPVRNIIKT